MSAGTVEQLTQALTAALVASLDAEGVLEAKPGDDEDNPESIRVSGNLLPSRVARNILNVLAGKPAEEK